MQDCNLTGTLPNGWDLPDGLQARRGLWQAVWSVSEGGLRRACLVPPTHSLTCPSSPPCN